MGLTNKQRGRQIFAGGIDEVARVYSADGAIAASFSHVAVLTKTSAGAYTLAAPAQDGIGLEIIRCTALAHVLTATSLYDNGTATKTTANCTAFAGASMCLRSYGGKWNVTATVNVTLT